MRKAFHDICNDLAVATASVQAFIDGKLETTAENLQAVLEALEDAGALVTQLRPPASPSDHNNESLLNAMVEGSPYAKVLVNRGGQITLINAQAEKLFGYTRDELLGQSIEILVPERFRHRHPGLRTSFDDAPIARPMGAGRDLYGCKKDGSEVPIEIGLNPIETEAGSFTLASITDITERKRAEHFRLLHLGVQQHATEVEELNRDLVSASRFKSEFVATMSHELRTPLNAIIGAAELLGMVKLDQRALLHVETISESAEALLSLINSILDFSKIESGKMDLHSGRFEVEVVLDGVGDVLAQLARKKGIKLHTYSDPGIPPVYGDADRLRQILLNLLGNAVKFTERGHVIVRVTPLVIAASAVTLRFEVEDTGIGIEAEVLPRLFEPFVQGDASVSRKFSGTGLGLSISKRLVELMNGQIGVQAEPGLGSLFWFTACFGLDSAPATALTRTIDGVAALIVSDDEMFVHIIERYLTSWHMPSRRARSAADLVKTLQSASGATWVVIVDCDYAGGEEMTNAINTARALLPVGVIGMGGDGPVRKPVRPSQLFDAIVRAADIPKAASEVAAASIPSPADRQLPDDLSVLVAEDNGSLQRLLKLQFEELNVRVTFVSDGAEAVDMLRHHQFSMVFMDCQMPNMDGLSATRAIREEEQRSGQHIPIAAMTANAFAEDRAACLEAGMDDYLAKPVKLAGLRAMIRRWSEPSRQAS